MKKNFRFLSVVLAIIMVFGLMAPSTVVAAAPAYSADAEIVTLSTSPHIDLFTDNSNNTWYVILDGIPANASVGMSLEGTAYTVTRGSGNTAGWAWITPPQSLRGVYKLRVTGVSEIWTDLYVRFSANQKPMIVTPGGYDSYRTELANQTAWSNAWPARADVQVWDSTIQAIHDKADALKVAGDQYATAKSISLYISDNFTYATTGNGVTVTQDFKSVWTRKTGNCAGLADLYDYMVRRAGITDARILHGSAKVTSSGDLDGAWREGIDPTWSGHAWNVIRLSSGQVITVDTCWDLSWRQSRGVSRYFDASPFVMSINHSFKASTGYAPLPDGGSDPNKPGELSVATPSLPNGTVGSYYSQTLGVSGGTSPYSWRITSGTLPAGLSMNTDGWISGTPSTTGTTTLTFRVTDGAGRTASKNLSVTVNATSATLSVATVSLPNGTVGSYYNISLGVSGGTSPYSWRITSGTLPAGLSMNVNGGIYGTPTTAQTSTMTFQVTDNAGRTASKSLSITISASSTTPSGTISATYRNQDMTINGSPVPFDTYTHEGVTYIRVRDFAYGLRETNKKFDVSFNSNTNAVELTTGRALSDTRNVLVNRGSTGVDMRWSSQRIYLNNSEIFPGVINVDGDNYVGLRSMCQYLNVNIYADRNGKVIMDTTVPYGSN